MKKLISLAIMLSVCVFANAQDIITFTDGSEVEANVVEITRSDVKYKLYEEPDGVMYTVGKEAIIMIKYKNGRNEVFAQNNSPYAYNPVISHVDGIKPGMKYSELKYLYNHSAYVHMPSDPYSPAWSGVASFFIPGLGQMICGEMGRGFAFLGGEVGLALVGALVPAALIGSDQWMAASSILIVASTGLVALDIWSIIDAVQVAKVKNMYTQDLRHNYSFDMKLHPSVNIVSVGSKIQPTVGMTLALKF